MIYWDRIKHHVRRKIISYNAVPYHFKIRIDLWHFEYLQRNFISKHLETQRNDVSIKMAIKFLVCKLYHKRARKKPLIYLFVIVEFLMYYTNTGCVPSDLKYIFMFAHYKWYKMHCEHITFMCASKPAKAKIFVKKIYFTVIIDR